jgi:hypothetical protein
MGSGICFFSAEGVGGIFSGKDGAGHAGGSLACGLRFEIGQELAEVLTGSAETGKVSPGGYASPGGSSRAVPSRSRADAQRRLTVIGATPRRMAASACVSP